MTYQVLCISYILGWGLLAWVAHRDQRKQSAKNKAGQNEL